MATNETTASSSMPIYSPDLATRHQTPGPSPSLIQALNMTTSVTRTPTTPSTTDAHPVPSHPPSLSPGQGRDRTPGSPRPAHTHHTHSASFDPTFQTPYPFPPALAGNPFFPASLSQAQFHGPSPNEGSQKPARPARRRPATSSTSTSASAASSHHPSAYYPTIRPYPSVPQFHPYAPTPQMSQEWSHHLSASLGALASQFQAASASMLAVQPGVAYGVPQLHQHAHVPGTISISSREGYDGEGDGEEDDGGEDASSRYDDEDTDTDGVREKERARARAKNEREREKERAREQERQMVAVRLSAVEQTMGRIGEEVEVLREQMARLSARTPSEKVRVQQSAVNGIEETVSEKAKEKGREREEREAEREARMDALEKSVEAVVENMLLDQARLYSRLLNASVNSNKTAIKAPPTANGKPPPNFPATKGEFEHLTKERYEMIMKAYGIPIKGDTAAKREAVREFLGLTPAAKS